MRKFLLLAALAALPILAFADPKFQANDFLVVALEYSGPHALVGVDTFGPAPKEALCQRSAAALVAESHDELPPGHTGVATCLHVKFSGPLSSRGAVIVQPFVGKPLQYVQIGVRYTAAGDFKGAQALSPAADANTCQKEARDIIDSNFKDGSVKAGDSVLIYCLPVPVLTSPVAQGGIV